MEAENLLVRLMRDTLKDIKVELDDDFRQNFRREAFSNEKWQRRKYDDGSNRKVLQGWGKSGVHLSQIATSGQNPPPSIHRQASLARCGGDGHHRKEPGRISPNGIRPLTPIKKKTTTMRKQLYLAVIDRLQQIRDENGAPAIKYFDLLTNVHRAMFNLSGDGFRFTLRVQSDTNHNHEELIESIETYRVSAQSGSMKNYLVVTGPLPRGS